MNSLLTEELTAPEPSDLSDFEEVTDFPDPDRESSTRPSPQEVPSSPSAVTRDITKADLDSLKQRLGPDVLETLSQQFRGEWLHVRSRKQTD